MSELRIDRDGVKLLVEYHPQAVGRADIERLVAILHEAIDRGAVFAAGEPFRMGWSTMRLVESTAGSDRLAFEELDGSGDPERWTRGVSRTLIATRLQRSVCESFSLPDSLVDFPSLGHSAIACDAIDPDGALYFARLDPLGPGDSGWFFSCRDERHDHDDASALAKDLLYAHACRIQAALPFLAMPIGSHVLLAADGSIDDASGPGGVQLSVAPGTYLAERRGRTSRV